MKVAVPAETRPGERRVGLVPALVPRLTDAGLRVAVEPRAGAAAGCTDREYRAAGATVSADALDGAAALIAVQPPSTAQVHRLAPEAITVSFLPAARELELVRLLRDTDRTAFAMELVPRISRAQEMDALSSQGLIAGYRSVLVAAERLPRLFPLLMTATGTLAPARVLVLGAGVAGLHAITTARRLGALVCAYDVRAVAADEIRSVGAEFVELDLPTLEGAGGYARAMTEQRARLQRERLAPHVAAADVLITTAAVPGRPAPLLVTRAMVEEMKPGSVVVDLAAEQGGNVEGSRPGEEVRFGEVLVWGGHNVPSQMPAPASRLYATNATNLLLLMAKGGSKLMPDLTDEIIAGCCVTHAGQVRHAPTRALLAEELT